MASPALFQPIRISNLELENRIVIAPMCQYSAESGCMTDWHLIHLGNLALSGAGLLTIEATAVSPAGRITYADVGLYDDDSQEAMGRVIESIRQFSNIPIGIQLSHAGRKASQEVPWRGGGNLVPRDPCGWQTFAPSVVPFQPGDSLPIAMDRDCMISVREFFADAASRAAHLGLDLIQIHAAHGYLLHQFLSPLSNVRDDDYGGSLANRMRFPLEVFDAVRERFPVDRPVSVRISATDWVDGGWNIEESIEFARALEARGCNAIHVSSGGLSPDQRVPMGPSYQVPFAQAIKAATNMPVIAVGLITAPEQAESILVTGQADMIGLARTIMSDPRWTWTAAGRLGGTVKAPLQYLRSAPQWAERPLLTG